MKIHLVTVGKPHLSFARLGWDEYVQRLQHYHHLRITHIADKKAYDAAHIMQLTEGSCRIIMEITGKQMTSQEFADFLSKRELASKEISFIIGGPEGLPQEVIVAGDFLWSLSKLTFPHDLAMVVLAEALYRAGSINAGLKYHK